MNSLLLRSCLHPLSLVRAAALVFGLVLTACGGGGGGDDSGGAAPPTVTTPVVTAQPASLAVASGAAVTFEVTATGNGLAYQWQRSVNGGLTWTDIAGASARTYTIAAVDAAMNGHQFHAVMQNPAGIVVSEAVTLTVSSGGGGGASGCAPANTLPVGTVLGYASSATSDGVFWSPAVVGALTVVGPTVFQGRSAFEIRLDESRSLIPVQTRTFTTFDATTRALTLYGSIERKTVSGVEYETTSIPRQPAEVPLYRLSPGESAPVTTTYDESIVEIRNGVRGAPNAFTSTVTVTYGFVGVETVTVPAGTFLACTYSERGAGANFSAVRSLIAGYAVSAFTKYQGVTERLDSFSVNGTPVTRVP